MRDRDDIPVETTAGRDGGSGMGDRLVVGLAALALLGGALILVGKGLSGESRGQSASGWPDATASALAAASSTPKPTPEGVTVEARPLPSPEPERPAPFSGWIRLIQGLPIYDFASTSANRIGALPKGAMAYAEEAQDQGSQGQDGIYWLQIDTPNPTGFIAAGKGGRFFVHRYLPTPIASSGAIAGIAASQNGFVAWGFSSSRANRPASPFLATSGDGRSWQPVDHAAFGQAWIQAVTYGPAGWLAMGSVQSNGAEARLWLWRSADGRSWRALGSLPIDVTDREAGLFASEAGYLLLLASYGSRSPATEGWHSTDGLSWTKGGIPAVSGLTLAHFVATRSGFYGWPDENSNSPNAAATYSPDGQTWLKVDAPPVSGPGRIVALGDGLLAVDSSPVTGAPRVSRGTFSKGAVRWTAQSSSLPRTLGFASLASSGEAAIVFGWDRTTDVPKAWSLRGTDWTEVTLPAGAFGGTVPTMTVGSPAGFVAVGSRPNLRADNAIMWAGSATGSWAPEPSPIITPISERTDLRCPARPADAAAFATLDVPSAVICFGRSPITFRTYLGQCQGCTGESADVYTPDWLSDPQSNQLYLSPIKSMDSWWFNARRANTLPDDPAWLDHWVELTGHFDDPASKQCRWVPDPHSAETLSSAQSVVNNCRQQFVVTKIRLVSGP
jgi:hypothetical protein